MKTVNHIIVILDIVLGAAAIAALIAFLLRIRRSRKAMAPLNESIDTLNGQLSTVKEKTARIKESEDSYRFFASLFIVLTIIKEAFRSWRKNGTLPGSFTGAYLRHSKQLNRVRK